MNWENHGSLLAQRLWYLVWLLFFFGCLFDKKLARAPQARQKLDDDGRYWVRHMTDTAQAADSMIIMSRPYLIF